MTRKQLSIVVIFHNMRREARRTLYSLSSRYQIDVTDDDYEVIAIDNGSSAPLDKKDVRAFGPNFRYVFFSTDSPSPVNAVNAGASITKAENIAVIVDGARMATPGIVSNSLKGLQIFPVPFVYSLSWHLGPDIQSASMLNGYNQVEEDRILQETKWKENGYRLFEISTIAPSSEKCFLGGLPHECSWLAMRRTSFLTLGGFEPLFRCPGGGYVNHDFRDRAMGLPGIRPVLLLGEGVFHQFHGGVCTNVKIEDKPTLQFAKEYEEIRGTRLRKARAYEPFYIGALTPAAQRFLYEQKK